MKQEPLTWQQLKEELKDVMCLYFQKNQKESMNGKEYYKYLREKYRKKQEIKPTR